MRVLVAAMLLAAVPAAAGGQTSAPPLRRIELAAGVGVLAGATLGDAAANLRSSTSSDPYRLFSTSTTQMNARVVDLRAGFDLTRRFGVEAHALFGHPELRTELSSDAESAPSITAVERLDHYLIDGGIVVRLGEGAGIRPFVTAGGGYLRQLHEGLTVIETGRVLYVGGGARHFFFARTRGVPRALGLRGDARLNILSGGITVDDENRRQVSASASVFVVF